MDIISKDRSHYVKATSLRLICDLVARKLGMNAEAKRDGVATSFSVGSLELGIILSKLSPNARVVSKSFNLYFVHTSCHTVEGLNRGAMECAFFGQVKAITAKKAQTGIVAYQHHFQQKKKIHVQP